jgi:hypothetical protein
MTSAKQIASNRRNATKSTGPTSPAGKAAVARNAVKHGLSAEHIVVVEPLERREDWERHYAAIMEDLAPQGAVEAVLAERIAILAWRLQRSVKLETAMVRTSQETVEDDLHDHRRRFGEGGFGETHPDDLRDNLRRATTAQRALSTVASRPDDAPAPAGEVSAVLCLAVDLAQVPEDLPLPGIADDGDLGSPADCAGVTVGQLRDCLDAVARAAGLPVPELLERLRARVRLGLAQARWRAEDSEREVRQERRRRMLPLGELRHDALLRYETTLERSLFRSLHELERLQARRQTGQPDVVDV